MADENNTDWMQPGMTQPGYMPSVPDQPMTDTSWMWPGMTQPAGMPQTSGEPVPMDVRQAEIPTMDTRQAEPFPVAPGAPAAPSVPGAPAAPGAAPLSVAAQNALGISTTYTDPRTGLPLNLGGALPQARQFETPEGYPMPDFASMEARARASKERGVAFADAIEAAKLAQIDFDNRRAALLREVKQREADQVRGMYADYRAKMDAIKPPEVPSNKQDVQKVGLMMASMAIIGSLLGKGGGQQSAMGAMQAMTGMMQGYMEGNAALMQEKQKEYENNVKRMKDIQTKLTETFREGMEMMPYNMVEAQNKMEAALAAQGADVLKSMVRAGKQKEVSDILDKVDERMNAIDKMRVDMKQRQIDRAGSAQWETTVVDGVPVFVDKQTRSIVRDRDTGQPIPVWRAARGGGAASTSSPGGAVQFRYNAAMAEAMIGLQQHTRALAKAALDMTLPNAGAILAQDPHTMPEMAEKWFMSNMSDADGRLMQQVLAGMVRDAAQIHASGRPGGMTADMVKEINKTIPQPNDPKLAYYMFLALVKMDMERGLRSLKVSGGTPQQIAEAEHTKAELDKIVTWNVEQVMDVARANKPALVNHLTQMQIEYSKSTSEFERKSRVIMESASMVPQAAVNALRQNPDKWKEFDEKYGENFHKFFLE